MKLKFLFLAFFALTLTTPAFAQAWGPDGEQTPVYPVIDAFADLAAIAAGDAPIVAGDNSNEWGGTPPASAYQPAAIDNPVVFTDGTGGAISLGGTEHKFRTLCNTSHVGYMDAIRGKDIYPFGHLHVFGGNAGTNQSSTYTSLRNESGTSTCPGRHLNNSAYWAPAVTKANVTALGGATGVKKPDWLLLYYVSNDDADFSSKFTRMLRAHTYIAGMNMDDPDRDKAGGVLAELATANASNIYASYSAPTPNVRWYCDDTGNNAAWIATAAGTDALSNCPSTSRISGRVSAPHCWDGHNLTSPTGYKHVRYYFREDSNATTQVCPVGWYWQIGIEIRWVFSHEGAADYTTWTCTSDAAAGVTAGRTMNRCESFHVDFMNAWDERASDRFQNHCIGVSGDAFDVTCDTSTLDATYALNTTDTSNSNTFAGDLAGDWYTVPVIGSTRRIRMKVADGYDGPMPEGLQKVSTHDHENMGAMSVEDMALMGHKIPTAREEAEDTAWKKAFDKIDALRIARVKRKPIKPQSARENNGWKALAEADKARADGDAVAFKVALAKIK